MMFRQITSLLLVLALFVPGLIMAEEEYWEYTFRPGDSIWKIAEKYTTTVKNWSEIQKINQIRQGPDRKIRPGTRILIPVKMLKLQPAPALVISVSGDVSLVRASGDKAGDRVKLTTNTLLYNGDRVITGDGQRLRIQFADKSELQVLPNSEVVLDKLSHHKQSGMVDTRIRLNTGSVNTWVEKLKPDSHYEIRTPAAITAVRGTAFRLSADTSQVSRTEVTEGYVGVSAGDAKKDVKHGYGIVAEKDKPLPEPVKLLPPPEVSDNQFANKSELHVFWKQLDGAEIYRYQLATDKDFNQIVIDSMVVEKAIKLTELQPGHYYLRVRGVDQFKLEGVDSINDYEIREPPPPPPPPPVPAPPTKDYTFEAILISFGMILLFL